MNVRAQVSMVFHLDKCIGCHTCSIACKNIWTDRKGTEYMWFNNVETKPGTGYPTQWEDQSKYRGGWEVKGGRLRLKSTGKGRIITNIFHNPHLPTMDDYYEPWTYKYEDLFNAPAGTDQPTALPISKVTGEYIDIESGPNWDDDLGGSNIYAANDPNLKDVSEEQRQQLQAVERLVFFYFPRICNHCLNPACVASCPSGALYKRGEDGIVLINQKRCRAWRSCVAACPYKKTYYNWSTGKSEKCLLCYPRLETGQAPACFHSCVGRIRYLGLLLYDADRIDEIAKLPPEKLVEGQRDLILDPNDPNVIAAARKAGMPEQVIEFAQRSPVYQFVKVWKIALPPHIEYRTLPMLYYVPPLLPVLGSTANQVYENGVDAKAIFHAFDQQRVPMGYLASLFSVGDEAKIQYVLRKLVAVRTFKRAETVGDIPMAVALEALKLADTTEAEVEDIYRMTSLPTFAQRFVIPPMHREEAIEAFKDPQDHKREVGFGFTASPKRGL
ncbi:MAG: Respiratory nitrate reductase 1 beta chain [Planctomycetes bacterium]|nr:Respiratory nitrate reductase 1 beta chain [Planctomycetota bacterium]MCQ3948241.1 nitrate reductase subunit beta [Planctomycetota bacterium]GIK52867.1 MAG: nitrate reductase subunit beta [Planctomycetota bacterium]HRJ77611.1 nitrate reductase subunit beta [Planctomycetota bacterium]